MPGLLFCVSAPFRRCGGAALRARLLAVVPLAHGLQVRGRVVVAVVDVVDLICGLQTLHTGVVSDVLAAPPVALEDVAADPPPIGRQRGLACRGARSPTTGQPRPARSWRMRRSSMRSASPHSSAAR